MTDAGSATHGAEVELTVDVARQPAVTAPEAASAKTTSRAQEQRLLECSDKWELIGERKQ
jgi:hypothetical protein